ncbi:uncharacterized protein ACBR49_014513 [Aulostomus maculatus]
MNLYRSFGNLMEAWVAEQSPCSNSEWLRNDSEDSPTAPDTGANLRTESVDSGVETASSDTSFNATSCLVLTDNTELFTAEREGEGLPTSMAFERHLLFSPVPSSSHVCPPRAQGQGADLHQKLEEALQRTDSKRLDNPEAFDRVAKRRLQTSSQPNRHTWSLLRGQRSESFGPRRTIHPSMLTRQMSEMKKRPLSLNYDSQRVPTGSEDLGKEDMMGLSPGLCYLEQVCQMLEEFARQQMHSQALQLETDSLQERQDVQASNTCQRDLKASEGDFSSCQRLESDGVGHIASDPQRWKEYPYGHFRQRSASDSTLAKLHPHCRGQHLSTDDEVPGEENKNKQEEASKTRKNWKSRILSLRRQESPAKGTQSQQMQSSERNSTQLRLSHLFRRTRKTLPVSVAP